LKVSEEVTAVLSELRSQQALGVQPGAWNSRVFQCLRG
jgi:hypothetical protein